MPSSDNNETKMLSIRDYARSHGIQKFDFIKVDVEGFELDVFNGIGDTCDIVFFEYNTFALCCHSRVNPLDFLEALEEHWILYDFKDDDEVEVLSDFPAAMHRTMLERGSVSDFVAVRKGKKIQTNLRKTD